MRFNENSRLGDIAAESTHLFMLLSRFEIPLGFGDKSVKTVCDELGVDCRTFLAIANFVATNDGTVYHSVSVASLLYYLRASHRYYCDFLLPKLREELLSVTDLVDDRKLASLIIRLFDDYAASARRHLDFENDKVFPYVEALVKGSRLNDGKQLSDVIRQHDSIDGDMSELKTVLVKYFPFNDRTRDGVSRILCDLFVCEDDLNVHSNIEDTIFIPAAMDLEKSLSSSVSAVGGAQSR
ncbi:MAG: hemerythrin domain-containing protein [Bacteroidales bacterium]|nr:hemerythrin domain-containing protein [Bacteroidales bacterium]